MKKWKMVVLGLCVIAWICLVMFGIAPWFLHADSIYAGQEVFLTQQSYDVFKADVKSRVYEASLKLNSFDVLASEPPIIVNFCITTPYDYEFPYGTSKTHRFDWYVIVMLSFVLGGALICMPYLQLCCKEGDRH